MSGRGRESTAVAGVTLRPCEPEDEEFLFRVYASTRAEELAPVPWSDADKEQFLRMQFAAQHHHYRSHFRRARFDVIERDRQAIGRLYVERRENEIRVIDIALLPEHRQRGVGGALMRELLREGTRTDKEVTIHVERLNPAMQLYRRLGFEPVEDQGVYLLMRWSPAGRPTR